eukprot:365345-Chlamydomonas_euryale.AAC.7
MPLMQPPSQPSMQTVHPQQPLPRTAARRNGLNDNRSARQACPAPVTGSQSNRQASGPHLNN